MKVISIQSQKGGAGKTTLTVHLASAAVVRGLSVRVLDADEQKSAVLWASMRTSKTPEISYVEPTKVRAAIERARADAAHKPFLVVLSSCPPRAPETAKARAAFAAAGVPVARSEIETRRPMDRALQYGESVIEFEPDGASARQINALLDEVLT